MPKPSSNVTLLSEVYIFLQELTKRHKKIDEVLQVSKDGNIEFNEIEEASTGIIENTTEFY